MAEYLTAFKGEVSKLVRKELKGPFSQLKKDNVKLKKTVAPGGYIVIDDGYAQSAHAIYPVRNDWLQAFDGAGVRIVAENIADAGKLAEMNAQHQRCIERRAGELAQKHPQHKAFFEGYVTSQQSEGDEMAGEVTSVLWLLRAEAVHGA